MEKTSSILLILSILLLFNGSNAENNGNTSLKKDNTENEFTRLNSRLAKGWNTWYTGSVLTHVLLPDCFSVSLMLKDGQSGDTLKEALIGREDFATREKIVAGPKSYDGSYSELELTWKTIHIKVQSAVWNNDLYLLITPLDSIPRDSVFIVPKMLWDRSGQVTISGNRITSRNPAGATAVFVNSDKGISGKESIKVPLDRPLVITSGKQVSPEEAGIVVARAKDAEEKKDKILAKTRRCSTPSTGYLPGIPYTTPSTTG